MKALVKTEYGPGKMEIREVEKPRIGAGEVLFEVKAAAICGSDIERFTGIILLDVNITIGRVSEAEESAQISEADQ